MPIQIDLSNSTNWASLSSGIHSVRVTAVVSGELDSNPTEAVAITKPAIGYQLVVIEQSNGGYANITYTNHTTDRVGTGTYQNVISIDSIDYIGDVDQSYVINGDNTITVPFNLASNSSITITSTTSEPG